MGIRVVGTIEGIEADFAQARAVIDILRHYEGEVELPVHHIGLTTINHVFLHRYRSGSIGRSGITARLIAEGQHGGRLVVNRDLGAAGEAGVQGSIIQ